MQSRPEHLHYIVSYAESPGESGGDPESESSWRPEDEEESSFSAADDDEEEAN